MRRLDSSIINDDNVDFEFSAQLKFDQSINRSFELQLHSKLLERSSLFDTSFCAKLADIDNCGMEKTSMIQFNKNKI
jgi:hypothetical protein